MKLKRKFLSLYLLLLFFVVIIVVGTKEVSSIVYQRKLYKEINNILNYVIYILETELDDLDRITFRISTNNDVQSELNRLNSEMDPYERSRIQKRISDYLQTYVFEKNFIQSIHLLTGNDDSIVVGKEALPFDDLLAGSILDRARNREGRNVFIKLPDRNRIASSRAVREFSPLTLRELGYVALVLDLDICIENLLNKSSYPFKMTIFEGDTLIFSNFEGEMSDAMPAGKTGKGYYVDKIGGVRYFTIYSSFSRTDWRSSIHIPYDDLFDVLIRLQYLSLILYGILVFMAIFISNKLIREIISPIEGLTFAMKEFENSNFEKVPECFPAEGSLDEINVYIRDFRLMTKKIEMLITENYKKKLKLQEAEFKTLQAQINPHFLYNTFDSINWLAQINGEDEISSMVLSLSSLLRNSINNKDKLISVSEEIELLYHYVKIQKIRFGDRLDFISGIPDDMQTYRIPKLTLQPLVENAINYGLEEHVGVCRIIISGKTCPNHIEISVRDNGPGMLQEGDFTVGESLVVPHGSGHGLGNIDDRIKILFGEDFGLRIRSIPGKGTEVILKLPPEKGTGE